MRYLADSSTVIRVIREQADPWVEELIADEQVAICEPVLREVMKVADKQAYKRLQTQLLDAYEWVPVPKPAWDLVRAMGDDLAERSMHNMFSVADYLVAAVAIHYKLTVLHNDKDFVAASGVFPQLLQHRITEPLPSENEDWLGQESCSVDRRVGGDDSGTGPLDARQALQDRRVLVDPASFGRRHELRVLA